MKSWLVELADRQRCEYGPIRLRREGSFVVVEIERYGRHIEVIREGINSDFDHTVYPSGIWEAIERSAYTRCGVCRHLLTEEDVNVANFKGICMSCRLTAKQKIEGRESHD